MNADAPPRIAVIHIQKIAPNPPRQIAVDTPMMFPVPTREAVDTINAPNEDTDFLSFGFSLTTLIDSPNRRTCKKPVRTVK